MQYVKPAGIYALVKGKLIDTVSGFVDEFNWMLSWISNFSTGGGLKIENDDIGKPVLSLNLEQGDGIELEETEEGALRISSTGGGGSLEIVGTSGSASDVKKITLAAASDTNISFAVSDDGEGNATITVSVKWANS